MTVPVDYELLKKEKEKEKKGVKDGRGKSELRVASVSRMIVIAIVVVIVYCNYSYNCNCNSVLVRSGEDDRKERGGEWRVASVVDGIAKRQRGKKLLPQIGRNCSGLE